MKALVRVLAIFGLLVGLVATAGPAGAQDWYFTIQPSNPYPAQYTNEVIYVRLAWQRGGVDPIIGAPIHSVWNYRTTTSTVDWTTGNDGIVALVRNIADATCGYTVRVDLYVGDTQRQIDSAYFTPCGDFDANTAAILNYGSIAQATAAAAPSYNAPPVYSPPTQATFQGPVSGSGYDCPAGYPVKANSNSGLYHQPWQQYYAVTNARNCYASAAAAEADGYRASKV
jgi:hypothetical protein